jgi:two-component system nitrate/nitrite response regulator NarL
MQSAYGFYSARAVREEGSRRTVRLMEPPQDRTAGANAANPIRVLIADGHVLFRQAIRSILEGQPDIVVVAEASDIGQVVSEAERSEPDVVLLDEKLSIGNVGHTASLLRASVPECRIVVLASDEDDDGLLRTLLTAMLERSRREREALLMLSRLTTREREVLRLLGSGARNSTIAKTLMISPDTARTHVQNLLHKLGLHSRLEAAGFARQTHLATIAPGDVHDDRESVGRARV